jgi:hypothetical protein
MREHFLVDCPYCGETVEIYLEAEIEGSLVQDCEVCCNPWQLHVSSEAGERRLSVSRADGSD